MPRKVPEAMSCCCSLDPQIKAHVASDVRNAVRSLANAAATAEAGHCGDEHQLWFLVRALCHENGMDIAGVMQRARTVAAGRIKRAEDT